VDVQELPLDELVLDPNLNLRDRLDDYTVERYAEAWGRLPPLTVYEVDGRWLIADGFHRHAAAVALGKRTVWAEVRAGTFEDALDFVAGVNLFHGLPLTRAERRRAVEVKLRLHHDWSDRRLAEELGVHRDLVAKVRRSLVEGNQIPANVSRVGADGKTYPATLARDPNLERPSKNGPAVAQQDDPRDRGGRESDVPPWDDTTDPLPAAGANGHGKAGPHHGAAPDAADRAAALADPVPPATPTIEEMLTLMTRQVMQVVTWTQAEGFTEAYRTAPANARGLFQTAALRLAARADQLRKG
jgi:ParB-like chromosome segregation protein Spo0J